MYPTCHASPCPQSSTQSLLFSSPTPISFIHNALASLCTYILVLDSPVYASLITNKTVPLVKDHDLCFSYILHIFENYINSKMQGPFKDHHVQYSSKNTGFNGKVGEIQAPKYWSCNSQEVYLPLSEILLNDNSINYLSKFCLKNKITYIKYWTL